MQLSRYYVDPAVVMLVLMIILREACSQRGTLL